MNKNKVLGVQAPFLLIILFFFFCGILTFPFRTSPVLIIYTNLTISIFQMFYFYIHFIFPFSPRIADRSAFFINMHQRKFLLFHNQNHFRMY